MIGMLQIVIYLLCVYLIYKGVEIFQIAYVIPESETRKKGMNTGIFLIIIAVLASCLFIYMSESLAAKISSQMNSIPNFNL